MASCDHPRGAIFMDKKRKNELIKRLDDEFNQKLEELRMRARATMLSRNTPVLEEEYVLKYEYLQKKRQLDLGTYTSYPTFNTREKPILFNSNSKREEDLYKLEQIFREKMQETFAQVAVDCGLISDVTKYQKSKGDINRTKVHIRNMIKTFNKRSIPTWNEKLISTGRSHLETVKLVPAD